MPRNFGEPQGEEKRFFSKRSETKAMKAVAGKAYGPNWGEPPDGSSAARVPTCSNCDAICTSAPCVLAAFYNQTAANLNPQYSKQPPASIAEKEQVSVCSLGNILARYPT
jgi:hypothetical protein